MRVPVTLRRLDNDVKSGIEECARVRTQAEQKQKGDE